MEYSISVCGLPILAEEIRSVNIVQDVIDFDATTEMLQVVSESLKGRNIKSLLFIIADNTNVINAAQKLAASSKVLIISGMRGGNNFSYASIPSFNTPLNLEELSSSIENIFPDLSLNLRGTLLSDGSIEKDDLNNQDHELDMLLNNALSFSNHNQTTNTNKDYNNNLENEYNADLDEDDFNDDEDDGLDYDEDDGLDYEEDDNLDNNNDLDNEDNYLDNNNELDYEKDDEIAKIEENSELLSTWSESVGVKKRQKSDKILEKEPIRPPISVKNTKISNRNDYNKGDVSESKGYQRNTKVEQKSKLPAPVVSNNEEEVTNTIEQSPRKQRIAPPPRISQNTQSNKSLSNLLDEIEQPPRKQRIAPPPIEEEDDFEVEDDDFEEDDNFEDQLPPPPRQQKRKLPPPPPIEEDDFEVEDDDFEEEDDFEVEDDDFEEDDNFEDQLPPPPRQQKRGKSSNNDDDDPPPPPRGKKRRPIEDDFDIESEEDVLPPLPRPQLSKSRSQTQDIKSNNIDFDDIDFDAIEDEEDTPPPPPPILRRSVDAPLPYQRSYIEEDDPCNCITFAAGKGGTGKSTALALTASHMVQLLAEENKTVCLFEGDPQNDIIKLLGIPRGTRSLATLARSNDYSVNAIKKVLVQKPQSNLFVLHSPHAPQDQHPKILRPGVYQQTLRVLKRMFDYVIVDTPNAQRWNESLNDAILPQTNYLVTVIEPHYITMEDVVNWLQGISLPSPETGDPILSTDSIGILLNKEGGGTGMSEQRVRHDFENHWNFIGSIPFLEELTGEETIVRKTIANPPPAVLHTIDKILASATNEPVFHDLVNNYKPNQDQNKKTAAKSSTKSKTSSFITRHYKAS